MPSTPHTLTDSWTKAAEASGADLDVLMSFAEPFRFYVTDDDMAPTVSKYTAHFSTGQRGLVLEDGSQVWVIAERNGAAGSVLTGAPL